MENLRSLITNRGVTLENAYVTQSLCCPSRTSILRGQYPHNTRVTSNRAEDYVEFVSSGGEASTFATWIHDAGYQTAYFGKYLNGYDTTRIPPGWDRWFSDYGATKDQQFNDQGTLVTFDPNKYLFEDVLRDKTLEWLKDRDDGKPFLAVVSTHAPHQPAISAPRHANLFSGADLPKPPSFNEAQVTVLTPFVDNADDIARWLAPDSHDDISLSMEWQPNDLAVLMSRPQPSPGRSNFHLELRTVFTTRKTLGRSLSHSETLELSGERPLGLTRGEVNRKLGKLAAATAHTLSSRGPVIVLAGRVADTWRIARTLQQGRSSWREPSDSTSLVQRFLAREFGSDFPLVELIEYGIVVHHSGLSDEARLLMEWLLEHEHLRYLVATTTIAQGVNFPVSGVVMASYQYPYGEDMPPEDFWNIAGRAGRVDHET
jgi:hypothetical protein